MARRRNLHPDRPMADRAVRATRLKTSHQPTVQQTNQLGMFLRTSTFTHVGWREHITEYRQTTNPPRRLHTHFCRGFGWATVRPSTDSNLLLLYQKTQAFRCLQTPSSPPDGFHRRRPRHRSRTRSGRVPTVKGAFRNPRTASVRLRCQPLSPIHSSGWGTQLQQAKENTS